MAITGWSTPDYLRILNNLGFGDEADDYFVHGWERNDVAANAGVLCDLGEVTGPDAERRQLVARAAGNPRAGLFTAGGSITADATADNPGGPWFSLTAWFGNGSDVEIWLDGANKGTGAGAVTFAAPDRFQVGANVTLLSDAGVDTDIAEMSVWDPAGFTLTNRNNLAAKLGAGESPLAINAESGEAWTGRLVAYWRLLDTTDLGDYSGNGFDLTEIGTLANSGEHPPVDILAEPGGIPIVGSPADFLLDRVLVADPGSVDIVGSPADLLLDRVLTADPGSVPIAGSNADFIVQGAPALIVIDIGGPAVSRQAGGPEAAHVVGGPEVARISGGPEVSGDVGGPETPREIGGPEVSTEIGGPEV